MIIKDAIRLLLETGFSYIGCNQPDVAIFYKPENAEKLSVCIFSDHTAGHIYTPEQLSAIVNHVERKFIFNGYRDIQCHFIIFTDNLDRDRCFVSSGLSFWLVDTILKRIIIYDNQPEDFYSIKSSLEKIIFLPEKKAGWQKISTPFITFTIMVINIVVFIIMECYGDTLNSSYMAEHGALYWRFIFDDNEYYRLISSMFLHFGSEHLINNMITLGVVGNEVERIIGHSRFAIVYLLSGIGAGLVSAVYNMNVNHEQIVISAGASGAIFGIIGSLLVVSLLYRNVRKVIKPVNVAIIAVLSIFNGFMNFEIDNMAHIGGLMFGIIITFISCLCSKSVIK